MPISMSRYTLITSGVGGGASVSTRNLGALVLTGNNLCPTGTVVSFTSAADVGGFFGTSSEEYSRAVFYFGWISTNITAPSRLSFYFWNNNTATSSLIFGLQQTYALSTFTAISAGKINLTLGGFTHELTSINFSAAGSLSVVASTLQTAIRAYSAGGAAWTGATVTYNATTSQFNLVSGASGVDVVSVAAGSSNDIAAALGWLTGAIYSNGTAAQTITTNLNALIDISNNFGSFCYSTALAVSLANITLVAQWNKALVPNNQFMFSVAVTSANASTWSAALIGLGGTTMTLVSPLASAYSEMEPMMILASTNYDARNSVFNYMFKQFSDTPSVTTNAMANIYDALRINYYGQTQTAGQLINFYQRGVMCGLSTDPLDQNTYANEIWMKDSIGASIMTLQLALNKVSANSTGRSQILGQIQSIISQAVFNGSISVGRTLTNAQKIYITNVTGDANAWQQVQSIGYWVDVVITPYTEDSVTKYKAVYTLVYAKDDVIRLVEGRDILI